jgi:nucleoside-diphosphate-sugar epimerase
MKIYITGATGVLGKRIVKELAARGHSVTGMARSTSGEDTVRSLGGVPSRAGLFDPESLLRDVEGSDVVIHAATSIPVKTKMNQEDFAENDRIRRDGTRILTECAVKAGVRKLIFQDVVWVASPADGSYFDENSPVSPDKSVQSGADGENIVLQSGDKYGFIPTVLRCGFFYGSDTAHTRTIGEGLKKRTFPIIGAGNNFWSNIHIDDAAAAFVTAALEDLKGIWHVVDDSPVKVAEFLDYFAKKLRVGPPRRMPVWLARFLVGNYMVNFFTASVLASNKKLRAGSSWAPKYPTYKEGVEQVLNDWKSEGFLL